MIKCDIHKIDADGHVLSTIIRFTDPVKVDAMREFFEASGALKGDKIGRRTVAATYTLDNVRAVFY